MKLLNTETIPRQHSARSGELVFAATSDARQNAAARRYQQRHDAAFTLWDLLALLAAMVLIAGVTAFSNGHSRAKGQTAICLDNLWQLTGAWHGFVEDNQGSLPGNLDGGSNWNRTNETWCGGWMNNSAFTPDNTNWVGMMNSQLGRYVRTPAIYRCPADTSLSHGRSGLPRVRSVSMNGYLGKRSGPYTSGYRQFTLMAEVLDPAPSQAFVFIDEREDSINEGWFPVDMTGWRPTNPAVYRIVDYPADRHNLAVNLSFVDGHAETWRWQDRRTMPAHSFARLIPLNMPSPGNPDVARLQAVASRPIR